jgi:hypothetical protein
MLEELQKPTNLTKNQWLIAGATTIGDMLDFFDFGLIAFVLAFIVKDWRLTFGEAGMILLAPGIRAPPAGTTDRVPRRSDSAPHRNEAGSMHKKLSRAAVEMAVRDQPVGADIGCRKMLSDIIVPSPRQVMTSPAPTIARP